MENSKRHWYFLPELVANLIELLGMVIFQILNVELTEEINNLKMELREKQKMSKAASIKNVNIEKVGHITSCSIFAWPFF